MRECTYLQKRTKQNANPKNGEDARETTYTLINTGPQAYETASTIVIAMLNAHAKKNAKANAHAYKNTDGRTYVDADAGTDALERPPARAH